MGNGADFLKHAASTELGLPKHEEWGPRGVPAGVGARLTWSPPLRMSRAARSVRGPRFLRQDPGKCANQTPLLSPTRQRVRERDRVGDGPSARTPAQDHALRAGGQEHGPVPEVWAASRLAGTWLGGPSQPFRGPCSLRAEGVAPRVGLEPTTFRLTAERSTVELPGNEVITICYYNILAVYFKQNFKLNPTHFILGYTPGYLSSSSIAPKGRSWEKF